ncbi:MAG: hypothetical protein WCF10_02125, partial [Polyangiales bacterium]
VSVPTASGDERRYQEPPSHDQLIARALFVGIFSMAGLEWAPKSPTGEQESVDHQSTQAIDGQQA